MSDTWVTFGVTLVSPRLMMEEGEREGRRGQAEKLFKKRRGKAEKVRGGGKKRRGRASLEGQRVGKEGDRVSIGKK